MQYAGQRGKSGATKEELDAAKEAARRRRVELGLPEEDPGDADYERLKAEREARHKRKRKKQP